MYLIALHMHACYYINTMSCSVHVPLLLYMHPVSAILEHAGTQTDSPEGDINSKAFWSKEKSCGEQD